MNTGKTCPGGVSIGLGRKRQLQDLPKETLVTGQAIGPYCREGSTTVGKPGSLYLYDDEWVFVEKSTTEGSIRKFPMTPLRACAL